MEGVELRELSAEQMADVLALAQRMQQQAQSTGMSAAELLKASSELGLDPHQVFAALALKSGGASEIVHTDGLGIVWKGPGAFEDAMAVLPADAQVKQQAPGAWRGTVRTGWLRSRLTIKTEHGRTALAVEPALLKAVGLGQLIGLSAGMIAYMVAVSSGAHWEAGSAFISMYVSTMVGGTAGSLVAAVAGAKKVVRRAVELSRRK